ncbi:hypothetical protein [Actinocorallia sp. A-T 12471]|uniref:hypothetical protein n=1 Tax=Actinocorallia sp. A-T 12471 TaxID=3089813 RepID=UPI0029CD71F5|nr:hypothetical protein [Actinocorallia sp. A-T 12471]MDX6738370.1 hypothetical protein [Actinocorallia sp. A-T 12471]
MTITGRAPSQTAQEWMRDRGDLVWRKVWFGVELVLGPTLRVSVTDLGGNGRPAVRAADSLATGGRGLHLVAELAHGYGIAGDPVHGHTVWAEILPPPEEHGSVPRRKEAGSFDGSAQRPRGVS